MFSRLDALRKDSKASSLPGYPVMSSKKQVDDNLRCKYSVNGDHKANVVMKDNDLREKIRLPAEVRVYVCVWSLEIVHVMLKSYFVVITVIDTIIIVLL